MGRRRDPLSREEHQKAAELLARMLRDFREFWGIVKHSLASRIDGPLWKSFATLDVRVGMFLQDRWDDDFGGEGNPYRPIWHRPRDGDDAG
jgi:hypothetical protein